MNFLEKVRRIGQEAKNDKTEGGMGVGRRSREEIVKVKSNESPEIPGREY